MDDALFRDAKQAYDAGDYRAAAKGFLAAAGRGVEGNGSAYHMAGNSLMRLRRHADAITVYCHALKDALYDRRGAVLANLAAAHVASGDYAEAVEEYRKAAEEPDYPTRYKALQGMAGALVEMSHYEQAAVAYRQAALDGDNPNPGKALNSLGLCLMALGRPGDAVEAYKAALGFDTYAGRGKALANLGIAFNALGEHREAVKAFEKATGLHGHTLAPSAIAAFEDSRRAVPTSERQIVEGWATGELPGIAPVEMTPSDITEAFDAPPARSDLSTTGELFGNQPPLDTEFFTRTDSEMKERNARRAERNPWQLPATIVTGVLVVAAIAAAVYFSGYGFPTQAMTVDGMLEARADGEPVEGFWVAVPSGDVDKEMSKVPAMIDSVRIGEVDRAARTSKVAVTVTPDKGAPLRYTVTLSREGFGWKVSGIENDWSTAEDPS
ncbi:MAG: tetratricopeptide repeat protein [Coriobacteriia bacterium]